MCEEWGILVNWIFWLLYLSRWWFYNFRYKNLSKMLKSNFLSSCNLGLNWDFAGILSMKVLLSWWWWLILCFILCYFTWSFYVCGFLFSVIYEYNRGIQNWDDESFQLVWILEEVLWMWICWRGKIEPELNTVSWLIPSKRTRSAGQMQTCPGQVVKSANLQILYFSSLSPSFGVLCFFPLLLNRCFSAV